MTVAAGIDDSNGRFWVKRQQAIIRAALSSGIGRGQIALLRVLLAAEDGRKKTVLIARETIAENMGACVNTVDRNMSALVGAKAVEKVYKSGGRHKANVYKITIKPLYLDENGLPIESGEQNLPHFGEKPTPFCNDTYPKMGEPSSLSYLSKKREGVAKSDGLQSRPLDPRQDGSARSVQHLTDPERGFIEAMQKDLRTMSYGEARILDKARRAAGDKEKGL